MFCRGGMKPVTGEHRQEPAISAGAEEQHSIFLIAYKSQSVKWRKENWQGHAIERFYCLKAFHIKKKTNQTPNMPRWFKALLSFFIRFFPDAAPRFLQEKRFMVIKTFFPSLRFFLLHLRDSLTPFNTTMMMLVTWIILSSEVQTHRYKDTVLWPPAKGKGFCA